MIEVPRKLVEGYFVRTVDDLIFEVKGVVHPSDRVIAYVRYVPDFDSLSKQHYRKIYDLQERERYLKENFPGYLWFSTAHQRILQAVPYSQMKQVLDPVEHMKQIRRSKSGLSFATAKLVDSFLEYTGVDSRNIGITGSQLVGVSTKTSDIDLVVFGEEAGFNFYDKLRTVYDKIPGLEQYNGDLLTDHVRFRWRDLVDHHEILREIESTKVLQGVFSGYQFFVRLVRLSQDVGEVYGQIVIKGSKSANTTCKIIDDSNSIFTPCVYLVESVEYPLLRQLVSYRGRFTEQGLNDSTVIVRGRLEDVVNLETNENYQQLVLGENSLDYMIPV
jgi:predicted nucleotidyltransferase